MIDLVSHLKYKKDDYISENIIKNLLRIDYSDIKSRERFENIRLMMFRGLLRKN